MGTIIESRAKMAYRQAWKNYALVSSNINPSENIAEKTGD